MYIRLSVCMCVCPSAMTLKWHNIVNSQYIAIQLYMMVDTPPPPPHPRALEQLHCDDTFCIPQIFEMQYLKI